ncbi:MAG: DHA2 family efflux MFS transporter permease subunit [Isosphaeraceae bacterium]
MSSESTSMEAHSGWTPHGINPWVIAFTVTLATFMEVLDTSIANVALPHIAGSLSVSVEESTWVLTSYLVANAIVLPLSGWLSMLMGRKRFYMTCVVLFTISSALCGMATSMEQLVFFRVLQGLGGGGLQPSEQAILVDTFPPIKRGMAMAVYAVAILVAPILGPTLGGWITDNYSWRWIFFINVPVGILSVMLSGTILQDPPYLKAQRAERKKQPLGVDFIGLSLIALGLGCLEVVLDRGQTKDWFGSPLIVHLTITMVVSLVAAVFWELYHPNPIINLRLFTERNFLFASVGVFCAFAVLFGSTVLLPQMLQTLMGYSALNAGLVLSPAGFVTMLEMPIIGFLLSKRLDARWLMMVGMATVAFASFWMAGLNLMVSPGQVILPRCVQTLGAGMMIVPINAVAYLYIPKSQLNNASGLYNLVRNEGSSIGVAVSTTLLQRRMQFHHVRLSEHIHALNPLAGRWMSGISGYLHHGGVNPAVAQAQGLRMMDAVVQQQAAAMSFLDLFWLFGMLSLLVIPIFLFMKRSVPKAGELAVH